MEENKVETQNQNTENASQETSTPPSTVSFPTVGQTQKSGGPKTLLVLGALILVGILGFVIFKNSSSEEISPDTEATPVEISEPVATATPSPSSTPKAADKSKVKIQVQNGTGISGEAALLQTQLKSLGYTSVTIGNATSQDNTITIVTFSKSLSSEIVDELTKKLKELYKEVEVKTSTTATSDVIIVTGLRKGATAKPSSSPTPKASASVTSTSTPTATATPTATP